MRADNRFHSCRVNKDSGKLYQGGGAKPFIDGKFFDWLAIVELLFEYSDDPSSSGVLESGIRKKFQKT